jgi:hypothetical protein
MFSGETWWVLRPAESQWEVIIFCRPPIPSLGTTIRKGRNRELSGTELLQDRFARAIDVMRKKRSIWNHLHTTVDSCTCEHSLAGKAPTLSTHVAECQDLSRGDFFRLAGNTYGNSEQRVNGVTGEAK